MIELSVEFFFFNSFKFLDKLIIKIKDIIIMKEIEYEIKLLFYISKFVEFVGKMKFWKLLIKNVE